MTCTLDLPVVIQISTLWVIIMLAVLFLFFIVFPLNVDATSPIEVIIVFLQRKWLGSNYQDYLFKKEFGAHPESLGWHLVESNAAYIDYAKKNIYVRRTSPQTDARKLIFLSSENPDNFFRLGPTSVEIRPEMSSLLRFQGLKEELIISHGSFAIMGKDEHIFGFSFDNLGIFTSISKAEAIEIFLHSDKANFSKLSYSKQSHKKPFRPRATLDGIIMIPTPSTRNGSLLTMLKMEEQDSQRCSMVLYTLFQSGQAFEKYATRFMYELVKGKIVATQEALDVTEELAEFESTKDLVKNLNNSNFWEYMPEELAEPSHKA